MVSASLVGVVQAKTYTEIEWTDLMPQDDLSALLDPPEFLNEIEDGSQQDSVEALNQRQLNDEKAQRYREALISTRIIDEFNGKAVRIPGYIVPLEQNQNREVTAFFVVPYFGACLHMPPPPPNQVLYVSFKDGIALENLQQPYWFEGTLTVEVNQHELGTSAYTFNLNDYQLYE
ncbi:MAG: DUF3299 domain-containing protein [Alteromonadaceae bacterium]|nr:DUF3299 domain-containing protein [Alteromonadaceae bacterium]